MPCPDCERTVFWLWAYRVLTVSIPWAYSDRTVRLLRPEYTVTRLWSYRMRTVSVPCTGYTEYFCVLYGSHNTQRSFLYIELIDRFLGAFVEIKESTVRFIVSVCPSAWNNSASTWRNFWNLIFEYFLKICWGKFKFHENLTRMTGTLLEKQNTFMITSLSIFLRMRNISDRFVEKIKTHIFCSVTLFRKSSFLWNNVEKYRRDEETTDDNITERVHFARW